MSEDAIFRIYSMTKPIISVAAMMLVEEGRLSLLDPLSAYIPAFNDVKVGVANSDKLELKPLKRPITVQDLLRHTSGFSYGFTGVSPVQRLTKAANVFNPDRTTAENVEAIAALPLMHQPGEVWEYGVSTDVLGRVVEIVEGARLGDVLRFRIFGPLGMTDTAFFTPELKLARRADPFSFDFMTAAGVDAVNVTAPPKFEGGGGGLVSTLADYTRFAAMLANGGDFEGARLLSPRTIAFMASDHLDARTVKDHYLLWPGHGFGLGFAVRTDPRKGAYGRQRRRILLGRHDGHDLLDLAGQFAVRRPHGSDAGKPGVLPRAVPQPCQRRAALTAVMAQRRQRARHQTPVFGIETQGSAGGRGAPFWRSSIEMLSGVRTNAILPSRGGRLMVTPASMSFLQSA